MNQGEFKDDDEIINSLRQKYTPDEIKKLLDWYNAFDDKQDIVKEPELEDRIWDILQNEIDESQAVIEPPVPLFKRKAFVGSVMAIAASLLMVWGWFWLPQEESDMQSMVGFKDVPQQELVLWQSFTNTTKAIHELPLPDGSKVWLNPATTILYKIVKNAATREVYLEGEAFFDVKPNKEQPFYVKNKGLNVVVLGTSFNVIASSKDVKYEVSVVTGKVKVKYQDPENGERFNQVIITPQQQVVIQKEENTLETHDLTLEKSKHRQLWEPVSMSFDEVILDKVLARLEQEYGMTIRTPNMDIRKCELFANFNNQRLPVIMDIICSSINATYQIEGNEITIIGEGCL
ncbi:MULTISPECIES: FecR family protein [unclassified Arcicella]|uniref:FecR family protein n=1 Tax=unclassified Arcicella TaxID=2644986 RepID=UPI002854BFED|nr:MULTISPECIES: FecR family protein [unclassified Arcicella]MDR6560611.1 ferric-dicitrate binding protein FerR (iron transport regulator) [Arcicella sp. BE51]MDR6810495.1 ferric-dicitrate binding protein FerR (iron transport regulator) [Arcicella sp. BE140]MDR6821845.1 ferric-dicitrate binding protein FerR (iron transport regulator) [Arcicella sp. BE139]